MKTLESFVSSNWNAGHLNELFPVNFVIKLQLTVWQKVEHLRNRIHFEQLCVANLIDLFDPLNKL